MTMIAALLLVLLGVASARPRGLAREQMRNAIFKNTETFEDILDNDTGFKAAEESNEIGWTRNGDLVKSLSEDYYVDYYFYEDPVINIQFKRSIGDNLSSSEQEEETVAPRSEERRANAHPSATHSVSERRRNRALRKMLRRNRKLRKSSRRNRKVMSNRT